MAADRNVKTRKRSGGWTVAEELVLAPRPKETVDDPPPVIHVTWQGLHQVFSETIGACLWRQFGAGEVDLTLEQRTTILERALEKLPLSVANVQALLVELRKPSSQGWTLASSYYALVRIAEDFLKQARVNVQPPKLSESEQRLLDELNRKAPIGVSQNDK